MSGFETRRRMKHFSMRQRMTLLKLNLSVLKRPLLRISRIATMPAQRVREDRTLNDLTSGLKQINRDGDGRLSKI